MARQPTKAEWAEIQRLFDDLVDVPAAAREARLIGDAGDGFIAEQVRSLLAAASSDGILDGAAPVGVIEPQPSYSSLSAGDIVGAFTIDRLIGRGGMGEVYAAHRADAGFEQQVALKLLRPEAAERADMFDRERRLLAGLEHPGIARLIDGGRAPDGRAYMAMEYVEGVPIDAWCRDNAADLQTRLRLIIATCDAVAYAHANLIIHRDLKPSNIMVDQAGRVRLLDFGIAKILDDSVPAMATQVLLTPDYAAPEQLGNATPSVATDVYALGAVLYELLAGQGPWRGGDTSLPSIIRRVLHDDPALPSEAAGRSGTPVSARLIAGDLDAIVMKAMRRKPEDRYRSAMELADDLQRHLDLKPVRARAGSTGYAVGRFVRRYRWAVGAGVAALLALLIGAGGIAWQARQTAIERDVALGEARRSESINRMLTVMFRDTAAADEGETATVKQMLDQTANKLVRSLDTSPKSATLVATLFDLYVNLEDSVGADTLVRQAIGKGIGQGDPVASAQLDMRLASSAAATGKTDEMAPLLDSAETVFRGDPARFRSELVEINSDRAQLFRRTGRLEDAITLLSNGMPAAEQVYVENHRDLLTLYNNLLVYMVEANQLEAMPAVFARADAVLKRTGQEGSMQGLGITQLKGMRLLKLDQPAQAETIFRQVASRRRASFGRSAGLAVDLLQLSRAKLALGQFADAKIILLEARPMATENLGPKAVPTLVMGLGLAEAMAETGDVRGADRVLGEVAPLIAGMPKTAPPRGLLARTRAVVLLKQGRTAQAKAALEEAERAFKDLGPAGIIYLKALPALRGRIEKGS